MSSSLQAFDSLRPGSSRCRINFLRMIKELCMAAVGVLVRMKARVAATSTSAVARNAGSVIPMFSSESSPMEETLKVIISEPVTDSVNTVLKPRSTYANRQTCYQGLGTQSRNGKD